MLLEKNEFFDWRLVKEENIWDMILIIVESNIFVLI